MHFSWYLAHFKTKYNIYKQPISMMRHTGNLHKEKRSAICNLKWRKLGIGTIAIQLKR